MLIRLSTTQVIVNGKDKNSKCMVCVDGDTDCTRIGVQLLPDNNEILLSSNVAGRHNYTLKGCFTNSIYSQQPGPDDLIYVGLAMPYQTAQTTPQSSTYITPLLTSG